ncbi:monovalent cation/H+ antiporter complex subunit F [Herbivorax sp. ANBcel31]|uniref:monovalent cation/H+ antiporter complex subunit F n=1 Tax=Herbivorax sp. ANBcel31 TaxID=3069754 RepID=UPI0027AF786C|nr:monovalent cation/H+ antiporter complex subunit F [Herbivorax sp. ANBcel31]MDQ2086169.1 monovalent cation/H+ antiporter complex subunit F [Herbivorax sp. ANBcel31]
MFINYALISLVVLAIAGFLRIVLGPTIWDRLLGFNIFSAKIIMLIVLYSVLMNKTYLLDIAIVYALLGFIGIILFSRFIQWRGKI